MTRRDYRERTVGVVAVLALRGLRPRRARGTVARELRRCTRRYGSQREPFYLEASCAYRCGFAFGFGRRVVVARVKRGVVNLL
jgi:hypothetical protein